MTFSQLQFYVANGFAVFPCSNINKTPLSNHGFLDASLDLVRIETWHAKYPDCAWGTPTSSEYAVVDIDPRHDGDTTWNSIVQLYGPIPMCPSVQTGGLGFHYAMRFPEGTRCGKIG